LNPDEAPERDYEPIHPGGGARDLLKKLLAPVVALVTILFKFAAVGFKFASIFIAVGGYALIWGWKFAVGFVALIFVHEMGHFIEARLQGLHSSWPTFIPFLGAYVTVKGAGLTPWRNARVSIAGPILGGAGAAACWAYGESSGSQLLQALGYVGFMINLLNLIPIGFFDGGQVWRSARLLLHAGDRTKAFLAWTLYFGTALALALGMWASHVEQHRL
jgi:Zn-dependent protease